VNLTTCDLCKEILPEGDKKFVFALYPMNEEDEDTKKMRFAEILDALYKGKRYEDNSIKVTEICNQCAGVFAHFMNLRKKELIKSRREVKRMLSRKVRTEKKKETKKDNRGNK
jgi:hypothetical protein